MKDTPVIDAIMEFKAAFTRRGLKPPLALELPVSVQHQLDQELSEAGALELAQTLSSNTLLGIRMVNSTWRRKPMDFDEFFSARYSLSPFCTIEMSTRIMMKACRDYMNYLKETRYD